MNSHSPQPNNAPSTRGGSLPNDPVRPGSPRAWLLAARPKTLAAAVAPVAIATALACADGQAQWGTAALCALFALLMQVAANFINDLFDFLKGTDGTERLGPERACAQGWIGKAAMRRGICCVLFAASLVGLAIVWCSGKWFYTDAGGVQVILWPRVWALIGLGVACLLFSFLYTTLLSYCGLGDLLVYLFFGFVPVLGTYFVQTGTLSADAWWLGAAQGLATDTLLVLNNFRDRDTDRASGKRTLIALLGARFGSRFYLLQGLLAVVCALCLLPRGGAMLLVLLYVPAHLAAWRTMVRIGSGRALNSVLGMTARNILLFSVLCVAGLLLQ